MSTPGIGLLPRRLLACAAVLIVAQCLFGCDYARMDNDEAVNTYEIIEPKMQQGTVPITKGYMLLKEANPEDLSNPVPYDLKTIRTGQVRYNWYCVQCHGPDAGGDGTVGQSFVPLPTDLKSEVTRNKTDGEIFYIIMFGFNKMPPLVDTVTLDEAWRIVNYIRWLEKQPKG